ncbi:MAG: long-chain fatty acid--CoA ligase [Nocardioidaceae bacterium]
MREFAAPTTWDVPLVGNLTDDVVDNADQYGDQVAFSRREGAGWADVTWAEFLADVTAAAKGLLAAGVEVGDRVALVSKTRYAWTVLDYAIWFAGAVTVPVYETSSAEQIGWILADSGAMLALAETPAHLARITEAAARLPDLRRTVCIDAGDLERLVAAGADVTDATVDERRAAVTPDSLASLIYTSGTTGRPKGCRLTHGNFMAEVGVATRELHDLFEVEGASTLLFLPLAHVFARVISVGCVRARVRVGHTADVQHLVDDLAAFRPTFILAVPRVFEKVFNTASGRAASDGKGRVFDAAVSTAIAYSQAQDRRGPGVLLRGRHAMFDRLVYVRLRAALGGKLQYAVSGGAPLGERLAHFYRGAGVPILEGYGLTETTAALTVNLPAAQRIGTVGRPLPGTTVRVADDGELLFFGDQVFEGYWRDDAATQESLVDGWLHTGDVGEMDDDGYVRITGRLKEILVTAGGKNVAPAVLEDRVRAHPLVSQCMVVGDGRPFVAALVTLDAEAAQDWLATRNRAGTVADLVHDREARADVQLAVDDANASVSRAEAIRTFAIVDRDWTEETGELTPTLKLKRSLVLRRFHDEVEALYH